MKIYDTLLLGCGYTSIGYATENADSVICEEHQICDTGFYLTLRSFAHKPYTPKTEEGRALLEKFDSLSLFSGGMQNANGFEGAMCRYISEKQINLLLKCRVIRTVKTADGIYDVTVQTNAGLTHLFAKNIVNTVSDLPKNRYTVLFVSENVADAEEKLLRAFSGASIEPAFYQNRYALHLSVAESDENLLKLKIYEIWKTFDTDAKILYMCPVAYSEGELGRMCDGAYQSPIEAFEAGMLFAKEMKK